MYDELKRRAEEGRPIRIALIGAGKSGSMFLSQARRVPGLHLVGIADLSPARTWLRSKNSAGPPTNMARGQRTKRSRPAPPI